MGMFFMFPLFAQTRSFGMIFPGLPENIRTAVFSNEGYIITSEKSSGFNLLSGTAGQGSLLDPQIAGTVLSIQPGFIVESLRVIPGAPGAVSLLDVYNALGNIRGLKGRLYHSHTRDGDIPLFEDASRMENERKNVPIPDPRPASTLPSSETVYIRLKDVNFGNSYYRGEIRLTQYGLRYSLSNYKNLSYFFIPVIREEKFIAQLYFEPIQEGVLIYSIAGADVSDFISSRIHMPSAISKRLAVIISWVAEGIGGSSS
ncbi:MAG: hypothetical protein LBH97_07455 [Treponema sp.]|nr:hypothetical protein [Treponema sp.]